MNKVSYSPMALNDLDDIWEYITYRLSAPNAAEKTINGILDAVDRLNDHSKLGAPLYFESGLFSGYRYVRYKEYLQWKKNHRKTAWERKIVNCYKRKFIASPNYG